MGPEFSDVLLTTMGNEDSMPSQIVIPAVKHFEADESSSFS